MVEWYRHLGFRSNPLTIKPGVANSDFIGDSSEVLSILDKKECAFVEAPLGMGKTTLLKNIVEHHGGKRKIIYYNQVPTENIPLNELIRNSSRVRKYFGYMPRELILLFDEAQNITKQEANVIAGFLNSGHLRSVVFFGTKFRKRSFPSLIRNKLKKNLIPYVELNEPQAIELVRGRVGDKALTDQAIKEFYLVTESNPRRLLELCEKACHKFIYENTEKVSGSMARKMLGTGNADYDVEGIRNYKDEIVPVTRD